MRLLVLVALVLVGTVVTSRSTEAVDRFGPSAVWQFLASPESQNTDVFTALQQCGAPPDGNACVMDIMQDTDASRASIEFFQETGWFMIDYEDFGRIDLGTILLPWRANANQQYVLLNGDPDIVFVEDTAAELSFTDDPSYGDLTAAIEAATPPNGAPSAALEISAGDNAFEDEFDLPIDGQQFVFQFEIVDGCRACGTGYNERIAYDFSQQGVFIGAFLSGACRGPDAEVFVPGITACPPVQ